MWHESRLTAGGPTGNRTQNPRIKSPLLCRLSYRPRPPIVPGALDGVHTGGVDAGTWGIVAVLVIGTAVVIYGWWSDRAAARREAEELRRPPDRDIPRFHPEEVRPHYLSELEAVTRPEGAPPAILGVDARHLLTERLNGAPSFPAGWPNRGFITDPGTGWCVLEAPLVLVCADEVTTMRELLPAVRAAKAADRPLVVVAPEVSGDILATLRANLVQQTFPALAVELGDPGLRRSLCSLTGGALATGQDLRAGYLPKTTLGECETWVSDEDTSWVLLPVSQGLN